jgi:hypothetical protein
MPEEQPSANGRPEHPSVHYEKTDASFPWIIGLGGGVILFAVIAHLVVWLFFVDYGEHQSAVKRSPYPLASAPSSGLPAEPRLEQIDRLAGVDRPDAAVRQPAREETLAGYGPTSEPGYVHIPIDRAIERLADRLPVRAEARSGVAARDHGLLDAGASNSGRLLRRGP